MREDFREATVVMCKCKQSHKAFGIRMEKRLDSTWYCTWAFKLNEKSAKNEGYDDVMISGKVDVDSEYPGCPYCGSSGWFSCGSCKKLTCYENETNVTCGWCGNSGECQTSDSFDLKGSGY